MRKTIPHIITILICTGLLLLVGSCRNSRQVSIFISLSRYDKNPYGAFVFHEYLTSFFPEARVRTNNLPPGSSEVLNRPDSNMLYIILTPDFNPMAYEMEELFYLLDRGNTIFISSFHFNKTAEDYLKTVVSSNSSVFYPLPAAAEDSMRVSLNRRLYSGNSQFSYPGKSVEGYFLKTDPHHALTLGYAANDKPNLIAIRKGPGTLLVHTAPLALSNYFLLSDRNEAYFEKIFSQFSDQTRVIIWDQYFGKPHRNPKSGWFSAIMKNNYFRTGILTALFFLILFAITEFRRKQRLIPVVEPPVNDSLEFVKTMGLLYYEKGDHQDLARKMSTFFLEHVRSRYQIFTAVLDDKFVQELSDKSGVTQPLVAEIVALIKAPGPVTQPALIRLQQKMEDFYNNE
ncbi:hypothetical protein GCM10027051_01570 [Niabella terrae]